MVEPAIMEQILKDLDRLSPQQQRHAAELVSPLPKGTPGRELLRFVGTIDQESARQMKEAIEEGCERVDSRAFADRGGESNHAQTSI